jgi:L,D-transpeptidase catalytic domain
VSCLTVLITSFSGLPISKEQNLASVSVAVSSLGKNVSAKASLLYDQLKLVEKGLSKEAFDYAYKGYTHLLEKNIILHPDYLTICDFSQSSKQKRLYLIDLASNKIVLNTYVAHGRNSGCEYATRFSNSPSSLQSSLGFYITKNTYKGEHGLSLRVEGLEPGINDNAYQRAIVIHGAAYIGNGCTGRSYGCPAVPQKQSKTIINTIKNGTCLFVYNPAQKYLQNSKILND